MLPYIFESSLINIQSVWPFVLIFVVVYYYFFWRLSNKELKNETIFDIATFTLLCGVLCARLVAFVDNLSVYLEKGWSVLPISSNGEGIGFLQKLPWSFFNLFDGNFIYIGIFLGIAGGIFFLYMNSNKQKTIYHLLERIVVSYAVAGIFLLIGLLLLGFDPGKESSSSMLAVEYYDGVKRIPLQVLQMVVLIILLVVKLLLGRSQKQEGIFTAIAFMGMGLAEVFIRIESSTYEKSILATFDLAQVVALIIAILGLFMFINVLQLNIFTIFKKNNRATSEIRDRRANLRENEARQRFSLSFADREQDLETEDSIKERFTKASNTIKRKFGK